MGICHLSSMESFFLFLYGWHGIELLFSFSAQLFSHLLRWVAYTVKKVKGIRGDKSYFIYFNCD